VFIEALNIITNIDGYIEAHRREGEDREDQALVFREEAREGRKQRNFLEGII
jgi:hypothetical protein